MNSYALVFISVDINISHLTSVYFLAKMKVWHIPLLFMSRGGGGGGEDSRGKVTVGSECLGSRNLPSGIL